MNEKRLERLRYYNGQPLDAADMKIEQEYHIRTRRWLNKSLYSAGIARGLDVRKLDDPLKNTPFVAVGPGLALDNDGREIILLEETIVEVCSYAGMQGSDSTVVGNYLVIEYAEEMLEYESGACAMRTPGKSGGKSTSRWGGPSRIESKVRFSWVPFVPQPTSNQIVLARVEVDAQCTTVQQIDQGARTYIGAASAAKVKQYALEGEREVAFIPKTSFPGPKAGQPDSRKDVIVTGRVYFHIRGRTPSSLTLYLKAQDFSTLRYTELGAHAHGSDADQGRNAQTGPASGIDTHTHSGTTLTADNGKHGHTVWGFASNSSYDGAIPPSALDLPSLAKLFTPYPDGPLPLAVPGSPNPTFDPGTPPMMIRVITTVGTWGPSGQTVPHSEDLGARIGLDVRDPTGHGHTISGETDVPIAKIAAGDLHHHDFSATIDEYGVASVARSGNPLRSVANLRIAIDGVDKTNAIRDQIVDFVADAVQKAYWQAGLGNGASSHPLANDAIEAVPIRLDFLPGASFGLGQHLLEFSVDAMSTGDANGGKILYNLYVE